MKGTTLIIGDRGYKFPDQESYLKALVELYNAAIEIINDEFEILKKEGDFE